MICGGFSLGSTTLGGSTIKLCTDCMPNLIISITQQLKHNGISLESFDLLGHGVIYD